MLITLPRAQSHTCMQRAASEPPRTAFMASISAPSMPMPHQQSVPLPHMMAYPTMFFVPVVPQPYVDVYQGNRPVTDIQALKHAIISAQATPAGTPLQHGDVWRLLSNVSFTIGERGFTNMVGSGHHREARLTRTCCCTTDPVARQGQGLA